MAIGGTSIGPVSVPVRIRIMAIAEDGKGLRSWDIAHPRLWGTAINEGNVPWAGSERITADEDIEETIMLGLRIREGLDTRQFSHLIPEQNE